MTPSKPPALNACFTFAEWVRISVVAFCCALTARATTTTPLTIEDFCNNDAISSVITSPDGTMVAFQTSTGRDLALAVLHLDTGKVEVVCQLISRTKEFRWKGNDRILIWVDDGDMRSDELWSVSPGKHAANKFPGYPSYRPIGGVFDWLPADPKHILEKPYGLMDVVTGEISPTFPREIEPFTFSYYADTRGVLRLRFVAWDKYVELQHRWVDHEKFVTVRKFAWEDPEMRVLGFAGDPNTVYCVTYSDADSGALHAVDTTTFKPGPALASFPGVEIRQILLSRDESRLIGLRLEDQKGRFDHWFDPEMRQSQAVIDASLPGRRNLVVGWSNDLKVQVALSTVGPDPGIYYVFDRRHGRLLQLGPRRPQLEAAKLGPTTAEDIKTRDGFTIHAILTVPAGKPRGPYPLVLIPRSLLFDDRAQANYNPMAQFLASRGYAVLFVDYRGTSGYGWTYEKAGWREIAGEIPDDIEDAARWSIREGYAQQGRICVYGSDLGGTLALIAATYSPELYGCVINEDGEPDLPRFGGDALYSSWLDRKVIDLYYGNNLKVLAARSPLPAIDRLRAPILNIYENSNHNLMWGRLESALKRADKPYVLFKNLDHDALIMPVDNRLNYFRQIADFLAKEMPAQVDGKTN